MKSLQQTSCDKLPCVDPGERIYAVGDIHGRQDLLVPLLAKLSRDAHGLNDKRRVRFIFLGDYIDRGDRSKEVLDLLIRAAAAGPGLFEFLLGNHEAALLGFMADPVAGADWLGWGGRQTLTSYGIAPLSRLPGARELHAVRDQMAQRLGPHLPFLQGLKRYAVSGDVIFAHASLDPGMPVDAQSDAALLWGRGATGQGAALAGHRLVHGHFDAPEPVVTSTRICVDTGAYYSGRLTAVRLDDDESFLQVDAAVSLP